VTAAWRDVHEGRRDLDWHVALGDLEAVPHVTVLGRSVAARAAHDLEAFFGAGWLTRATASRAHTAIAGLVHYWPSLGTAGAYGNVIGLWASLQVLVDAQVHGIGEIRKSLRANLQEAGFRHALTQVRLAAQGLIAGHRVMLEPPMPDGDPGDLSLAHADTEVFLEIKTFNPDRRFIETGEHASATQMPVSYSDQGRRLWRDLDKKARQAHAAGAAWVWVQDNSNTLWAMTRFAQMPLGTKVKALNDLVGPLFDTHPHLVGVVLTSESMPDVLAINARTHLPEGLGFRRALPGARVRESIVLHRRLMVPGQLALIACLCADEPLWLDRALARLGIAGGLASLTTHYPDPRIRSKTTAARTC